MSFGYLKENHLNKQTEIVLSVVSCAVDGLTLRYLKYVCMYIYIIYKYCVPDEKEQFQQIVLYDMLHFCEEMRRRMSEGGG